MRVRPARRVRGVVRVPGDKSISHRAALLAAVCDGRARLSNYSTSADCAATLACLQQLGVAVERDGADVSVTGAGLRLKSAPAAPLDCGNSGTTMRLLAGLLAGQAFAATLTGDDSLRARPMRRVVEPLELMGARVETEGGRAPLRVVGRRPLRAITYATPVASAQVKSCVLLAGLNAAGRTRVVEQTATRDHTERLLRWFGVEVETSTEVETNDAAAAQSVALTGPAARLAARDCAVPGDLSAAAFFLVAAALLPGSDLTLRGVGLNPTRTQIVETLRALGADIEVEALRAEANEPAGDVRVRGGLAPTGGARVLRGPVLAGLIDELPILCVLGTRLDGGLTIRDARELRVKETDRISAMVSNLRAMGAEVEEYEDGLALAGPARLRGARLEAHGDHRIAMACAVAALTAAGDSEIVGADAVAVSFPDFFARLAEVVEP
ncbi:MAG TPA: 3-phosphoshikimate 1-carboxyvinyltransferase [Pyrinomonadaceae bacterium]|jgi:3-phosphoshikimate 1-carboxyvinyltransferase